MPREKERGIKGLRDDGLALARALGLARRSDLAAAPGRGGGEARGQDHLTGHVYVWLFAT